MGFYSYIKLPIDAFPDVTNIQVEVVGHANGLSALEIERSVTYPIEMSMRGLPKVKQMRSVTKFGLSLVTIVFEDNVDIYFARQLVFERLAEAKETCSQGRRSHHGTHCDGNGGDISVYSRWQNAR